MPTTVETIAAACSAVSMTPRRMLVQAASWS